MEETLAEIKRHLSALGLKVSGTRKECEERLEKHLGDN